ncbi:hypothetical protein, partial [Acetobacter sp.]|uniref:hypothetical protein n=1 Tax=Acetobacter sp. TaxID=440 RepID=UPI0039EBD3F5
LYIGDTLFWCHLPVRIMNNGKFITFNSMMDHMLHGRFDVDPDIVGKEGFLRNGHVYAYWGILPALLRLPFLLLPNGLHLDITRLSCAIAAILMFFINFRTVRYVTTSIPKNVDWLRNVLFAAIALTGVQIGFLRPSIFQEVCLWSLVFGMLFVHWAVRACLNPDEAPKAFLWMSIASSLALLTRVSMGIGAYAAEGFLGFLTLWRYRHPLSDTSSSFPQIYLQYFIAAAAILGVGIAITAGINFERWGNPLTFANYNLYLFNIDFPDRLIRTRLYGLFNVERIPLGIIYFFFPIWIFHNGDHLFFQTDFARLLDAVELPASSFFLTDGVFLLLGSFFFVSLISKKTWSTDKSLKQSSFCIIAGLAIPPILMLMAISMNYRYRAEFYPLILFMAFMGARLIFTHDSLNRKWLKPTCWGLVVVGALSSHIILVLYDISNFGPSSRLLAHGVLNYYLSRLGL